MKICRVEDTITHNEIHKTIFFDCYINAKPGQFIMIWLPGIDEIPMSLSHIGSNAGITVKIVGDATKALYDLNVGDKIGIRGPYGNGYEIAGKKALFVSGGIGIASLLPLIKMYKGEKKVILAGRNEKMILFADEISKIAEVEIATDDGSIGFKGFATELMEKIVDEEKFDIVYTCGPEKMMRKVLDMCIKNRIKMQASLERYMKCGIGICGSCGIGKYLVCRDGPVFNDLLLKEIPEFGAFTRLPSGRKIRI
ncbi:MAG: dihydroorotate dehydrogenase electron transfer subunit [Thermoplasmata archaeon]|nr:dihydroorotate dehydrogenase electron transfer subunit [Thermoplasmata archaeon]